MEICGAVWRHRRCCRPTERALSHARRAIKLADGTKLDLCRPCYNYLWTAHRETGIPRWQLLGQLSGSREDFPKEDVVCAREGCTNIVPADDQGGKRRRRIEGEILVCYGCYQLSYEVARQAGVSHREGLKLIGPKWQQREPTFIFQCRMPWCNREVTIWKTSRSEHRVYGGHFVCVDCQRYLSKVNNLVYYGVDVTWQMLAIFALFDDFPGPGSPLAVCAAPWCNRAVDSDPGRQRTPNGLDWLCWTDAQHLRQYARRHGITKADAWGNLPVPRLVHTRGNPRDIYSYAAQATVERVHAADQIAAMLRRLTEWDRDIRSQATIPPTLVFVL